MGLGDAERSSLRSSQEIGPRSSSGSLNRCRTYTRRNGRPFEVFHMAVAEQEIGTIGMDSSRTSVVGLGGNWNAT